MMFKAITPKMYTDVNRDGYDIIIDTFLQELLYCRIYDDDNDAYFKPISSYFRIDPHYNITSPVALTSIDGRSVTYADNETYHYDGYEASIDSRFVNPSYRFITSSYMSTGMGVVYYAGVANFDFTELKITGLASDHICAGMVFDPAPMDLNTTCKIYSTDDILYGSIFGQERFIIFAKLKPIKPGDICKYIVMTRAANRSSISNTSNKQIYIIDNTIQSSLTTYSSPLQLITSYPTNIQNIRSKVYAEKFTFRNRWYSDDIYWIPDTNANQPIAIYGDMYYPLGYGLFLKVK